ncbi:hypothetical protein PROFUN_02627 [Planoprotostelium fungivorum]|uniref:Uncharacterized protein n=1 Tax=Planoprotostelium fungivorum TaxID=1890364 RepID=A0A2P6NVC9_9EUKA|nr:hypothetical protein PROFUN_02627 [Planoprotostelium fungivorum]
MGGCHRSKREYYSGFLYNSPHTCFPLVFCLETLRKTFVSVRALNGNNSCASSGTQRQAANSTLNVCTIVSLRLILLMIKMFSEVTAMCLANEKLRHNVFPCGLPSAHNCLPYEFGMGLWGFNQHYPPQLEKNKNMIVTGDFNKITSVSDYRATYVQKKKKDHAGMLTSNNSLQVCHTIRKKMHLQRHHCQPSRIRAATHLTRGLQSLVTRLDCRIQSYQLASNGLAAHKRVKLNAFKVVSQKQRSYKLCTKSLLILSCRILYKFIFEFKNFIDVLISLMFGHFQHILTSVVNPKQRLSLRSGFFKHLLFLNVASLSILSILLSAQNHHHKTPNNWQPALYILNYEILHKSQGDHNQETDSKVWLSYKHHIAKNGIFSRRIHTQWPLQRLYRHLALSINPLCCSNLGSGPQQPATFK